VSTNRFIRRVAQVLRETADLRAHYWRYEVSGAGWAPLPQPPARCSCCNRRAFQPAGQPEPAGTAPVRYCPACDRLGRPMVLAPSLRP
jgi:hypothetical protein